MLIDFGMSQKLSDSITGKIVENPKGTTRYLAPEQIQNMSCYTNDIW